MIKLEKEFLGCFIYDDIKDDVRRDVNNIINLHIQAYTRLYILNIIYNAIYHLVAQVNNDVKFFKIKNVNKQDAINCLKGVLYE